MNNELQYTPFDSAHDALDEARPPLGVAGGGKPPGRPDNFKRLQRILRGGYLWALPIAAALGIVGAAVGYRTQKPQYCSVGRIQIAATVDNPIEGSKDIRLYDEFIQNQVLLIGSRRVTDTAMQMPQWQHLDLPYDGDAVKKFVDNMAVSHPPHSEAIEIDFYSEDPHIAQAGAQSLMDAYEKVYYQISNSEEAKQGQYLSSYASELKRDIKDLDGQINVLAAEYGSSDLGEIYKSKLADMNKYESQLTAAELALSMVQKGMTPEEAVKTMTDQQIAMLDPTMRRYSDLADEADTQLQNMRARIGPNHPNTVTLQQNAEAANRRKSEYAEEFRKLQVRLSHNMAGVNPAGGGGNAGIFPLVPPAAATLQQNYDNIKLIYDQTKAQTVEIGRKQLAIKKLVDDRDAKQKDYDNALKRTDMRQMAKWLPSRFEVLSSADEPTTPSKDKRLQMALLMGMAGAGLPIVIFAAFAMVDRRYRYSDEATMGIGQTPLLGILPTLPDKLSDPEQASIAAHCIHQIRIMLQMARGEEAKRTFMLTSASTGDGKTSVCLALGLSFASSGSRTLLIDCDLIGQGLTHRMRLSGNTGLCEALLTGTLQGHVQKAGTKGLWVLPIGSAEEFNAGMMSPVSIRQLIAEARQHFDHILLDTGPALGSLEASLVAPEVDGVILAVARGQNQLIVERSLRHLSSLGARISGIVFNRAEKRDFNRSVVSSSIRSLSAKPAAPRTLIPETEENARLGPLARSVASFIPTAGGDVRV